MSPIDVLLALPTPLATLSIVGLSALLCGGGLVAFHSVVPHPVRRAHNEVVGYLIAVIGAIYAVLLAFIAVAVWEDFGRADELVQSEANLVGNLYRDTVGLPDSLATELRHDLFVYAETVVQEEWPALGRGDLEEDAGWQLLDQFHLSLARSRSDDPNVISVRAEMIRTLDQLYDARRGRFHVASASLPPILWWNLLAGAGLTVLFSYMFGLANFPMHLAMVTALGSLIALVLTLILLLGSPFRGQNHVSVVPFERLVAAVEGMSYPHD